MSHHYQVPLDGDGTQDNPYTPAHVDDIDDAETYLTHIVAGQHAVVASRDPLDALEDRLDGDVDALDPDDGGYPLPDPVEEEHTCDECGSSFDTKTALNGHMSVHTEH